MLRIGALWMIIVFLGVYAWKDWFKSLCGLILLMAVVQHPDFPNSIAGIQGLNPWNVLLLFIAIAWLFERNREGLRWDYPPLLSTLFIAYMIVMMVSYSRMAANPDALIEWKTMVGANVPGQMELFSEKVINRLKWVIPALMVYDGARTRERIHWALASLLAVYVLLAIQVINTVPLEVMTSSSGSSLSEKARLALASRVGYHRVNMAMMLAGASWALYCARGLVKPRSGKLVVLFFCAIVTIGLMMTGGRMGYVTWGVLGVGFAVMRWRWMLLAGPVLVLIIALIIPGPFQRLQQGVDGAQVDTNVRIEETMDQQDISWYTVSSGRVFAWPFVIRKISESPVIGHGEEAMKRTGIALELKVDYNESFPHPHNAYLQWTLDTGFIGLVIVIWFYGIIAVTAFRAFVNRQDETISAIGGVTLALIGALFVAGIGSQTFYPREGAVCMWVAMAILLRSYKLWKDHHVGIVDQPRGVT